MAASRVPDVVNGAVDALKADSALGTTLGGAKVFTHVLQGTQAPYLMVMGGTEVPWAESFAMGDDEGDNGGRQVDVLVQCASTYRGSTQVDGIASRVMEVLLSSTPWAAVSGFSAVQFIRNEAGPPVALNDDGVLWFLRLVTIRVSLA